MNEIHEQTIPGKQRMHFLFIGILIIYILIRVIVWQNNITNLEDADSARYLIETRVFKNFAFNEIINFSPDSTPFYPFFSGLFSLPGWSVETGARLCSLFFSIVLFFAIIGIGKHFTSISGILVTLFIITFNAVLMRYSISVLTEPSYIAVIYLGFWLFCSQNYTPTIKKVFYLGLYLVWVSWIEQKGYCF